MASERAYGKHSEREVGKQVHHQLSSLKAERGKKNDDVKSNERG